MSMAKRRTGLFQKDGKYQIYVPGRVGLKQRSTGTSDKILARNIKRAVLELKDRQELEILDALYHGKIKLSDMYSAYAANSLTGLKAELRGIRLADHVDGW